MDEDAPPVTIARTEVKEEGDDDEEDEEEPAPEAAAAEPVQPSPASPRAKAAPSSSAPAKQAARAGRVSKEEWDAMLIDTQFEESYIANHHLNGQADYRRTEVEEVQGKLVPGVVIDGRPYMSSS